jgi:hypothetical protein
MKHLGIVVLLALFTVAATGTAEETFHPSVPTPTRQATPAPTVGPLGTVDALVFRGNQTHTTNALRQGLLRSPEFLTASHPKAPLDNYLKTVRNCLLKGYQNDGFAEVTVQAEFDVTVTHLRLDIVEGPRYNAGEIRVTGANQLPVPAFIRALTQPAAPMVRPAPGMESAPDKEAFWVKDSHPAFDAPSVAARGRILEKYFADFGLFFVRYEMNLDLSRARRTADLHIRIVEEGPPGILGEIEVTGNARDTREEILKYLELSPGRKLDRSLLQECENRLWNSGRYLQFSFAQTLRTNAAPNERVELKLRLREFASAPPLRQTLTREQAAAMKLGARINEFTSSKHDFVLEFDSPDPGAAPPDFWPISSRLVLSPANGLLFDLRSRTRGADPQPSYCTLILSPDGMAFHNPARRQKIEAPKPGGTVTAFIRVTANPPTNPDPFMFSMGGGFSTLAETNPATGQAMPLKIETSFPPVATFHLLTEGTRFAWRGDSLSFSNEKTIGRINAASGTLEDLSFPGRENHLKFRLQAGAFGLRRAELAKQSRSLTNLFDPQHPWGSVLSGALQQLAQPGWLKIGGTNRVASANWVAGLEIGGRLLRVWAEPLGRDLHAGMGFDDDRLFTVPEDKLGRSGQELSAMAAMLAGFVFQSADILFKKDSWPWTIPHEAVFVAGGNSQYTGEEMKRLYESPELGPLGCLALANLMAWLQNPSTNAWAQLGRQRLTAMNFRDDCRLLLEGGPAMRQATSRLADACAQLTGADLDTVASLVTPKTAAQLRQAHRLLRERQPGRSVTDTLEPVLNELWQETLRDNLAQALKKFAAPGR